MTDKEPSVADKFGKSPPKTTENPGQIDAQRDALQILQTAEVVAGTRNDLKKLEKLVARSDKVAKWMDRRFLDAIIGAVIPIGGDLVSSAAGLYIISEAIDAGVPTGKILQMLTNMAIDVAGGFIPGIGDIFDIFFRSNVRNTKILRKYLEEVRNESSASPSGQLASSQSSRPLGRENR